MWALILDCRGHVACAHGAHMHVSRGKSFSGVPVNRLLFTAKRKTCSNWFNCKNHIIPFHLITCPLHRVQAPLLFSPQLSSPQHVMSFRLEYSKNRKKTPRLLGVTCFVLHPKIAPFQKERPTASTQIYADANYYYWFVFWGQRRGWITAGSTSQSNCSLETFETEGSWTNKDGIIVKGLPLLDVHCWLACDLLQCIKNAS